jgi:hypothetical protein
VMIGPVNFRSAEKKQRPLLAFIRLPLWSAGAAVAIVVTGAFAKGCTARARHLTLIEAAAGAGHAEARRYRGFFVPRSRSIPVRASSSNGVLDTTGRDRDRDQRLELDRDGLRIQRAVAPSWQTLVVREDAFADLSLGVSIVPKPDGDALVVNRSGRALRGVLVSIPGQSVRYLARIDEGGSALASLGKPFPAMNGNTGTAGSMVVHGLELAPAAELMDADTKGLSAAWSAIATVAGSSVDWFPTDLPVVLAQLDGGEGTTSDSGVSLDSDRALLRVIGYGGTP